MLICTICTMFIFHLSLVIYPEGICYLVLINLTYNHTILTSLPELTLNYFKVLLICMQKVVEKFKAEDLNKSVKSFSVQRFSILK